MPARCAPGAVLDEEQHVQAAQEHGTGVEEVRGQDGLSLAGQERPPGLPGSPGCGAGACVVEDLPYGRWRDRVSQAGQLAVDTPVAPGRIVPCHLQCQRAYGLRPGRPPRSAARAGPAPLDQIGVPVQQRRRGDNPRQLTEPAGRQQPGQRGHNRPVSPRQPRRPRLALEHGELVAQDADLGVFGAVGAGEQGKPAKRAEHRQISQS